MIRLGFALGGCLQTSSIPHLLLQLRQQSSDLELHCCLSPAAESFVTRTALEGITRHPVYTEDAKFDRATGQPNHLFYSQLDALVLYPATARIVASTALGLVSCPVTRTFAFMPKERIVLTPYLHPAMHTEIYREHLEKLETFGCRVVEPDGGLLWRERCSWRTTLAATFGRLQELDELQGQTHRPKEPSRSMAVIPHAG